MDKVIKVSVENWHKINDIRREKGCKDNNQVISGILAVREEYWKMVGNEQVKNLWWRIRTVKPMHQSEQQQVQQNDTVKAEEK